MASEHSDREHPRGRFAEKVRQLGMEPWPGPHIQTIFEYALDTLALVWPMKAHVFYRLAVLQEEEQAVANDLEVDPRTVRRWLHGHQGDWGAIDWLLILLELYREAALVQPGCEATLFGCFTPAVSGPINPLRVPFHRALLLAILGAFVGGDVGDLEMSFPWAGGTSSPPVVA